MKRISIVGLLFLSGCAQLPSFEESAPVVPVAEASAEPVADTTLSAKPQLAEPMQQAFTEAKRLLRQQHFSQAIAAFNQLVQQLPDAPGVWYNLAVAQWQSGQTDAARVSLQQALAVTSQHSDSHNLLGVIARQQGDMQAAQQHFQQALLGDAQFATAHKNLAFLYELYLQLPLQAHYHYKQYQQLTQDPQAEIWLALLEQELTQQGMQVDPVQPAATAQESKDD